MSGDGFDLVFDGIDLNGQGWVYHHYIRPTQHGFRPICHVLTTFQQNNLGIGYIGAIADIRHSEKGELLSLALLNPERFLFQLTPSAAAKWCKPSEDPKFDTYGRETIGGIVALDGKSVANLLVRTLDKAILDEIDTAPYGDEESEESAPTTGSAPEAASADPVRPS